MCLEGENAGEIYEPLHHDRPSLPHIYSVVKWAVEESNPYSKLKRQLDSHCLYDPYQIRESNPARSV